MDLHQPHDQFFKAIMQDKAMATDYIKSFLPLSITQNIDFSSLVLEDKSYIDELLKSTFSDIVYSCKVKNVDENFEIAILLEHKSYIDIQVTFQLLYYISSTWMKKIANNEKPILIVPVLFYHGKEKWEYQTITTLFSNLPNELKQYIPNFEYIFNNLQSLSDQDIRALQNQFLSANFLALKHYFDRFWLKENIVELFSKLLTENKNLKTQFIVYVLNFVQLTNEEQIKVIEKVSSNQKKEIMNAIESWKKEGMEIGMKKGIEKGIKQNTIDVIKASFKNGISIELIANITNMDEKSVIEILKEHQLI